MTGAYRAKYYCELPERKMDHRLVAVREKNKMASFGSLHNSCATIGVSQPSQRDEPMN
jgi:hypothetical protein